MDNIVVTGDDKQEISELKKGACRGVWNERIGSPRYFLGIELARFPKGSMSLIYLKKQECWVARLFDSPLEMNHRLRNGYGKSVDKKQYQRLVGKLICLSHTRPDIAYAASIVIHFMQNACSFYVEVVFRILRYLKSSTRKGILCNFWEVKNKLWWPGKVQKPNIRPWPMVYVNWYDWKY